MMWFYDGTLPDFLEKIFEIYSVKDNEALFSCPQNQGSKVAYQQELFGAGNLRPVSEVSDTQKSFLESDSKDLSFFKERSERVEAGIKRKAGLEAWEILRDAFLCSNMEELYLFKFIQLCMKQGKSALKRETLPEVRKCLDYAKAVRREAHLLSGLLRFKELDKQQGMYAVIKPEHDILPLLAQHFLERLGNNYWIIHDRGRARAAGLGPQGFSFFEGFTLEGEVPESESEQHWQEQWKIFFTSTSIKHKENSRLQRSHMPKKYWAYLVEEPKSSYGKKEKILPALASGLAKKEAQTACEDYRKDRPQLKAPVSDGNKQENY